MSTAILRDTSTPWDYAPKVVDRSFEDNLEKERDAAVAKINDRTERLKENAAKLVQLQRVVDAATAAVASCESKREFFTYRREQLRQQLATIWGKDRSDTSLQLNFDPIQGLVESYSTVQSIELALADFPRVHKDLLTQLSAVKRALAEHTSK